MKYISTRGQGTSLSFSDILFEGYAADGGLYVPAQFPKVDTHTLQTWRGLSYASLAFEVIRLFAEEIDKTELWRICADTYQSDNFEHTRHLFDNDEVVTLKWLHDQVGLLELSNGPSLAFDDIAMQFLARLFDAKFASGRPRTLLGATTGDMGASAEAAFGGHKNIRVIMLSPKDRMSQFQAAQLYSNQDANVENIEINGTFDECQDIVRSILEDREYAQSRGLGAINSVLWARIVAQIVYYFYGYLKAVEHVGEDVVFAVPGGNFGNAYACWVAKQMGLPVMRLIVCTNENDAMDEFLRTGRYAPKPSNETIATSSPSTDISRAASFERFLFDVLGRDGERVKQLAHELETKGEFTLTPDEFRKVRMSGVVSGSSNHPNRLEVIEQMHLEYDTYVDPHTADALFSGIYLHPVGVKTICVETVQPVKFPRMVKQATGHVVPPPADFADVFDRPLRKVQLPACGAAVREEIDRMTGVGNA